MAAVGRTHQDPTSTFQIDRALENRILAGNVGAAENYWGNIRPGAVQMGIGGAQGVGATAKWSADQPGFLEKTAGAGADFISGVVPLLPDDDDDEDD